MNLFLALFWSICAVMLLVYEHTVGPSNFRMRVAGHNFSWAWLMLLLVLYNLQRWWRIRSYRAKQRALAFARNYQESKGQRRSATPAGVPGPNFNFTNEPPASSDRGIKDQPPANL
jgi:hypothetical protein